jgi:Tol biopolymer transport system component
LLKRYTGSGGVFEIGYSPDGKKLAVCSSDKRVTTYLMKLVVLYVGEEKS